MLTLLVPILINYLIEGEAVATASKLTLTLHDVSLQWLRKIGPKYPQEFKKLMTQTSGLRARLENAIQMNQQLQKIIRSEPSVNRPQLQQPPSIKLKTDFSNFS